MKKQRTAESKIAAASPMVHEPGILPYRIVIRDLGDQFVVHTEVNEPDKNPRYHQGDYFTKRHDAQTTEESDTVALRKAWARFEERARRSLHMDPPPAKSLAQVSDIAESIITTLLPDDEDDCRDMINDDYQLESDIETFEHFTGKVIQPEDDPPIAGDEIEMEDIERSLQASSPIAHVSSPRAARSEQWTVEFGRIDSETVVSDWLSRECVIRMQSTRRRGIFKIKHGPRGEHPTIRSQVPLDCPMCKG